MGSAGTCGGRGRAGILKADIRCMTMAMTALRASTSTITRQSPASTRSGLRAYWWVGHANWAPRQIGDWATVGVYCIGLAWP